MFKLCWGKERGSGPFNPHLFCCSKIVVDYFVTILYKIQL